jgi:hypothetical protein
MKVIIRLDDVVPVMEMRPENDQDVATLKVLDGLAQCHVHIQYDTNPEQREARYA